jgi:hypothetical protein
MRFPAVVYRSRRFGGLRVPSMHGEFGIPTSNHEPASRVNGNKSTDFTSEFRFRRHGLAPFLVVRWMFANLDHTAHVVTPEYVLENFLISLDESRRNTISALHLCLV